jgi:hypothetical protein
MFLCYKNTKKTGKIFFVSYLNILKQETNMFQLTRVNCLLYICIKKSLKMRDRFFDSLLEIS